MPNRVSLSFLFFFLFELDEADSQIFGDQSARVPYHCLIVVSYFFFKGLKLTISSQLSLILINHYFFFMYYYYYHQ